MFYRWCYALWILSSQLICVSCFNLLRLKASPQLCRINRYENAKALTKTFGIRDAQEVTTTNDYDIRRPFGPKCIIISGLPESYLETVDDIFTVTLGVLPPVIIVNENDFKSSLSLRTLFEDPTLITNRDHAIIGRTCRLFAPVILFSGCTRDEVMLSIRSYKTWDSPQQGKLPKTAFALAVLPAIDKPISLLCDEILGDFVDEQSTDSN